MKRKIIYTDAPSEIEEAIANGKIISNFIDVHSLVRKDGTRPSFIVQKPQIAHSNGLKKVAAVL